MSLASVAIWAVNIAPVSHCVNTIIFYQLRTLTLFNSAQQNSQDYSATVEPTSVDSAGRMHMPTRDYSILSGGHCNQPGTLRGNMRRVRPPAFTFHMLGRLGRGSWQTVQRHMEGEELVSRGPWVLHTQPRHGCVQMRRLLLHISTFARTCMRAQPVVNDPRHAACLVSGMTGCIV